MALKFENSERKIGKKLLFLPPPPRPDLWGLLDHPQKLGGGEDGFEDYLENFHSFSTFYPGDWQPEMCGVSGHLSFSDQRPSQKKNDIRSSGADSVLEMQHGIGSPADSISIARL